MNWSRRHLNWTWFIAALLNFCFIPFDSPVPYIVYHAVFLIITVWVLYQKKRCWLWVIFPIAVLFLENKRLIDVNKHKEALDE